MQKAIGYEPVTNITVNGYVYIDCGGHGCFELQIDRLAGTDTVTITVEASEGLEAQASATYRDITQYGCDCLTQVGGASYTLVGVSTVVLRSKPPGSGAHWLRVRYAAGAWTGDTDIVVHWSLWDKG